MRSQKLACLFARGEILRPRRFFACIHQDSSNIHEGIGKILELVVYSSPFSKPKVLYKASTDQSLKAPQRLWKTLPAVVGYAIYQVSILGLTVQERRNLVLVLTDPRVTS